MRGEPGMPGQRSLGGYSSRGHRVGHYWSNLAHWMRRKIKKKKNTKTLLDFSGWTWFSFYIALYSFLWPVHLGWVNPSWGSLSSGFILGRLGFLSWSQAAFLTPAAFLIKGHVGLWFSQFCPLLSVCFVFTVTSLIVTRRLPTFYFASWIERGKKIFLQPWKISGLHSESQWILCLSSLWPPWGEASRRHQSSSLKKELVWKSRRQPTSYDTHRTHTPRQLKVWSTFSEQSSSLKLLEEKRHMAVSESTPSKSWAWVKYSWKWKYPMWIILGKFSIHLHLVHVHMYVYPRPFHTHSWY